MPSNLSQQKDGEQSGRLSGLSADTDGDDDVDCDDQYWALVTTALCVNGALFKCYPDLGRFDFQPHFTGKKTCSVSDSLNVMMLRNGRGGSEERFHLLPMLSSKCLCS